MNFHINTAFILSVNNAWSFLSFFLPSGSPAVWVLCLSILSLNSSLTLFSYFCLWFVCVKMGLFFFPLGLIKCDAHFFSFLQKCTEFKYILSK